MALAWSLDRPPILATDFPSDREAGERARDTWYEARRHIDDEDEAKDDPPLPVVDPAASASEQKWQRSERSRLWKRMLRRYNNSRRDKADEAERKRNARVVTRVLADVGDQAASARIDAEAERSKRRRLEAREQALALRAAVEQAQRLRAQQQRRDGLQRKALACALEPWEAPLFNQNKAAHYSSLHTLAQAYFAARCQPDGSTGWESGLDCAAKDAELQSEAVRSALLSWDRLFDPDYVEPSPFDPYGYHSAAETHRWACQVGSDSLAVGAAAVARGRAAFAAADQHWRAARDGA